MYIMEIIIVYSSIRLRTLLEGGRKLLSKSLADLRSLLSSNILTYHYSFSHSNDHMSYKQRIQHIRQTISSSSSSWTSSSSSVYSSVCMSASSTVYSSVFEKKKRKRDVSHKKRERGAMMYCMDVWIRQS